MGIQSIQDYIDSSDTFCISLPNFLDERKVKTSNLLIVHADSCIRQFYHEHMDWICGGQWNELLQAVDKFVRAFRQAGIELMVFFDGSLNESSVHNWSTKHRFFRDIVRETLSHIINNQNVPFRTKVKNFVAPGAIKSALRLAFRSFDVMVCCSLEDIYKETLLFGRDENSLGIIGNDANLFLSNTPCYINFGNVKTLKKILSGCKVYKFENVLKELELDVSQFPYLGALLGNFMINDATLSSFYWELIEEDHPLKKIQANMVLEAVLPPSEVRLKCVAKFLHEQKELLSDIDALAGVVFGKATNITVEEGAKKLQIVVDYYKDILKAASSSSFEYKDDQDSGLSAAGFPLPSKACKVKYKRTWQFVDKAKQATVTSSPPKSKVAEEKSEIKSKVENPEEVIKQGTLEEAAQALLQLELNETCANEEEKKEAEEESLQNGLSETIVVEDEKKPGVTEEESTPVDGNLESGYVYPREITVKSMIDTVSVEVLDVARKRHQNGQMCPEILNLLTKAEIILDLAVDDELTTERLPISLIFRPLRQLVYGVLFGVKQSAEDSGDEASNGEVKENGIQDDQKDDDSDDQNADAQVEETGNGVGGDQLTTKNTDASIGTSPNLIKIQENTKESSFKHLVKEWCIYGDRKLDQPDMVEAKGMKWGVPSLKKLWLGMDSEDNANRLKAFLSCMKSDTVNMSNTAMVPQRLMILCCVLRYLIQQDEGKAILTKQDIDAFLAQALSTQLTLEHVNSQNLANIKLSHIDARCVQLAAIFMSGVENAIIANDACGSPVPWEFCCPWNFFDGKLFHSKWLMSTMNTNSADLCDGKHHLAEKLERLRWCIVEGLDSKYTITGLAGRKMFNPFGAPIVNNSAPFNGKMRPAGIYPQQQARSRARGAGSKRTVHGSGGTLHVAGVPVAHWSGNKSGIGYSKNGPGVLVGGPNSVDLPSDHRRGRGRGGGGGGGGGARVNRGRGLLQTPFISPWQQGFGLEDIVNNTYQRYMKGVTKADQVRAKHGGKLSNRYQVFSSRTRNPNGQLNNQSKQKNGNGNINTNWFGRGRGLTKGLNNTPEKHGPAVDSAYGRGQWINTGD